MVHVSETADRSDGKVGWQVSLLVLGPDGHAPNESSGMILRRNDELAGVDGALMRYEIVQERQVGWKTECLKHIIRCCGLEECFQLRLCLTSSVSFFASRISLVTFTLVLKTLVPPLQLALPKGFFLANPFPCCQTLVSPTSRCRSWLALRLHRDFCTTHQSRAASY